MTTQLQLIEGAAPPRPKESDERFIQATAVALMPDLIGWLGKDYDPDEHDATVKEVATVLTKARSWDTYLLTKAFDKKGWDANSKLLGILEKAQVYRRDAWRKAVRVWVGDWNIQPEFAVGDKVIFESHAAAVAEVRPADGQYLLKIADHSDVGLVVDFERVQAMPPADAPHLDRHGTVVKVGDRVRVLPDPDDDEGPWEAYIRKFSLLDARVDNGPADMTNEEFTVTPYKWSRSAWVSPNEIEKL